MTEVVPDWAKHRILVLEDDGTLVEPYRAMFRRLKCHHVLTPYKEVAEAELAKGGFCLGCIDLRAPLAEGFPPEPEVGLDFIRESREKHAPLVFPMIAMTAFGDDHKYCLQSLELGANTFFKKPDDSPTLPEKIRTWLQKGCETSHPDGCPNVRRPVDKAAARTYPSSLRLLLHGEGVKGGGYRVVIGPKPAALTEQHVELLVKLALVDRARADGYADFNDLGFSNYEAFRQAIRRLGQALAEHDAEAVVEKHGKQVRIGTSNVVLEESTLKPTFAAALKWRPPTKPSAT